MDYDPLSAPTRRARRSLIAVSSISILAKLFCAQIEKLPVGGVSLNFDSGFLTVALLATVLYLIVLLSIYIKIDWTNRGRTPAQVAESEARQAVLVEVERDVKAVATKAARDHDTMRANPTVVDEILAVFWKNKSNPAVEKAELHASLLPTKLHENRFDVMETAMREAWQTVADRTNDERNRAIASKTHETRRFWWVEYGFPMLIAVVALIAFAAPNGVRDALGFDSCEAPVTVDRST